MPGYREERVVTRTAPEPLGEAERRRRAAETGGEPILDFEGERSPYVAYGEIDVLLSLQNPPSGTHDEMVFMISGQLMELLFKLMVHELMEAQRRLRADDVAGVLVTFARVTRVQELLVKGWDVVATLTAAQFAAFRDYLGSASGFQSSGYRHLEFVLGNKARAMLGPHRGDPVSLQALERALDAPSVYDDALALLERRGYRIDPTHLRRDVSAPYVAHESVEDAWLEIYTTLPESNELVRLGEALISVADLYKQWRYRHVVTVERIMGYKPGTGGTSGVEWLRRISQHEFFPDLWAARTRM